MKKAALRIAALAGILLVICAACRMAMHGTYMVYLPVPNHAQDVALEDVTVSMEAADVVEHGAPERIGAYLRVPVRPRAAGKTFMDIEMDGQILMQELRVGRFGTIYNANTGGFTGDYVVLIAFTAFCFAVAVIMLRVFLESKGPAFYAYETIYAAGFSLFSLLTGLMMLQVSIRHFVQPYDFSMLNAYSTISGASMRFVLLTSPAMLAFAVAMSVSNVALWRHEGFSPKNALGIGVGVLLVAGEALVFWLYGRDFSGSEWEYRIHNTLGNVGATVFGYFECMLIGAVVCGVKAAKHVPAPDADYILILGCRFRKNGTLTPLLQGRVDRAVALWQAQKEKTGKEAVLMPSGGQGDDEIMPEAEAMRRYLVQKGFPERFLRVEDRSRNTYQNMAFSRELIERENPSAKVAYVTTNYHVFRSGVWAAMAGLPAEGAGSRTKWWYWPNAFMRECVGLLVNRVRQEMILLLVLLAFFGALSMALG